MSVFIGIPMSLKVSPMSVTSRLCVIVWGYFYLYNMSQWAAMGYFMYQPVSLESCAFILRSLYNCFQAFLPKPSNVSVLVPHRSLHKGISGWKGAPEAVHLSL